MQSNDLTIKELKLDLWLNLWYLFWVFKQAPDRSNWYFPNIYIKIITGLYSYHLREVVAS